MRTRAWIALLAAAAFSLPAGAWAQAGQVVVLTSFPRELFET